MSNLTEYEAIQLLREKVLEARDTARELSRSGPGPERLARRQFFALRMREASELCRAAGHMRSQLVWLEQAKRFAQVEQMARTAIAVPWGKVATVLDRMQQTVQQLANDRVN